MNKNVTPNLLSSIFFIYFVIFFASVKGQNQVPINQQEAQDSSKHAISFLKADRNDFNGGFVLDPFQLIQARFPSLLIARGGNDPNGFFNARIRGVKSFEATEPLILIDGMPVSSLDAIHPNDIESVEILQDGSAIAKYGIRGSNGVIAIKSRAGKLSGTRIQYRGYITTENKTKSPDVLDAKSYLNRNGFDLGDETNWWDEVTQRAASQVHHISLSGGSTNSSYYGAINYDGVNGAVRNTGFERVNSRLSFEQRALNDRLTIRGGLGHTQRSSSHIVDRVYEQAISFNPTAPIFGEGPEFDRFGGYYQRQLYNTYNPVSLIEQIDVDSEYRQLNINVEGSLEILPGLLLRGQYGQMGESWNRSMYAPSTSYLFDFYKGYAYVDETRRDNRYFRTSLDIKKTLGDIDISGSISHHYQKFDEDEIYIAGGNFLTDAFSYHNLGASLDFPNGRGDINSAKLSHKISGFGANMDLRIKNVYFLSAAVTREGSSRLGENNKWGLFYGLNGGVHLNDWLQVRANLSKTGNLPNGSLWSQGRYDFSRNTFYNGSFEPSTEKIQNENLDLQWEETIQWGIGADLELNLFNRPLRGSIDFYRYQSDQLIRRLSVNTPPDIARNTYENVGALSGGGIEYAFSYSLSVRDDFQWNIGIVGAFYAKTILENYGFDPEEADVYIGVIGGRCSFPVYRLQEGQPIGAIWGHTFGRTGFVSSDNRWNFEDRNGDGYFSRDDYSQLGNAMPKASLGITSNLRKGNWTASMLLRGVFGHDMINHIKSLHSTPALLNLGVGNIIRDPENELRGLDDYPDFSERDVENASYLRLGYLTVGYDLFKDSHTLFKEFNVYVTAQNLFTITSYSGLDPELRMEDQGMRYAALPNLHSNTGNPLVHGQDRVNTYPTTRVFLIGVNISL